MAVGVPGNALFPELERAGQRSPADQSEPPGQTCGAPPVNQRRGGVVASDDVAERFAQALRLAGCPDVEVERVARLPDGTIELVVPRAAGDAILQLVPPGHPAWIQGPSFGVRYRGALPEDLEPALRAFARRYGSVPLERLREVVRAEGCDEHALARDDPGGRFFAWAPSTAWRSFLERVDLHRGACSSFGGDVAVVEHTEDECVASAPPPAPGVPTFIVGLAAPPSPGNAIFLSTDLRDRDVILGGEAKLEQTLEGLAARPTRPALVVVQSTCTPMVTGDDVVGASARVARRTGLSIVAMDHDSSPTETVLRRMLDAPAPRAAREPGAVALVGMPSVRGEAELFEWLADAGVDLVARVLPDLSADALANLAKAAAIAIHPWERHISVGERLGSSLGVPSRVMPSPFGPAGSLRWLEAMAALAHREAAMAAIVRERSSLLEAEWGELRNRARQYRLGFVAPSARWEGALSAQQRLGVAAVDAVEEMGFGVDIFVYARGAAAAPAPPPGSTRRVLPFASPEDLQRLLATSGVAAVHSDFAFDRRLSRTGVARFSLDRFRAGPTGALQTAASLLDLAALPFYRRYAAHLGRPFPERSR